MAKNDKNSLVKKFQKIEQELIELLKIEPINFDEESSKTVVKKEINGYIKKLNKAKKLFNEYEDVAEQIKKLGNLEQEIIDEVVNLREEIALEQNDVNDVMLKQEENQKPEYENIVQVDESGTKVVSKKKETKKASREF